MNIRQHKTHSIQCEINRLNRDMNNGNVSPEQFKRMNRRRSELLAIAKVLHLPIKAV